MYKIIIIAMLSLSCTLNAQSLKINFSSGTLLIEKLSDVVVEGYDGTEVLVFGPYDSQNPPPLSRGLINISSKPAKKEFTLKHSISKGTLKITSDKYEELYYFKVPRNVNLICKASSRLFPDEIGEIEVNNVLGEIEISSRANNNVSLNNVTGAVSVTTHGNINAKFDKIVAAGALSFDTYLGFVDISLPADSGLNVNLNTTTGDIYTDFDIKKKNATSNNIRGSIGSGDTSLFVNTETSGNIYIRRK